MKKILSLLALVLMSCMGAWAGTVGKVNSFTGYSAAPIGSEWAVGTQWFMLKNINESSHQEFYLCPSGGYLPTTLPTASNIDSYLWAFVGDAENGFQLYNKALGTSSVLWVTSSSRGMSADPTNAHIWDLYTSLDDGKYLLLEHNTEHNALNNNQQAGNLVSWDSDGALYGWQHTASNPTEKGDAGSNFVISGTEEFTVVVNGLVGEGGAVIAGENHAAGTVNTFGLLAEAATAIPVDGYDAAVSVVGNIITVTYTEHISTFPDAGTYFVTFTGQATDNRKNNLYNDFSKTDGLTLQAQNLPTPITDNNNYIWKAVCDGTSMTIVNGQGSTMKLKNNSGAREFNKLNYVAHNGTYYLKPVLASGTLSDNSHDCLNVSNGGYQDSEGTDCLTSWSTSSGPNAGDNHWAVNVVDITGLNEYTVSITGSANAYVTYNGQYALNGGFFLASSIAVGDLSTTDVAGYEKSVSVVDHTITVTYTQSTPDWAGLEAILAEAATYPYGNHLGEYSNADFGPAKLQAEMVLANHVNSIADASIEAVDEAIAELRTAINNLTLNMPAPNTFLRIKGITSEKYISGNGVVGSGQVVLVTDADANSILYLNESNQLVGFVNGLGFNGTHSVAAVGSFETHTFSAAPYNAKGKYLIKSNYTGSQVLCDWTDGKLNRWGTENDTRSTWAVEEVEALPVALTQVGELAYASFNAPVPVAVPSGVTAYKATINDNVLELTAFTGTNLAANTPVILTATTANTYNFDIVASGDAFASDLQGTVAKQNVATGKTTYVLNKKEGKIGFYTSENFINGFKAYCETTTAASNGLSFRFEDVVTAIDALHGNNSGAEIFDLQGRRLTKAQKGMNIINGHKVLVK